MKLHEALLLTGSSMKAANTEEATEISRRELVRRLVSEGELGAVAILESEEGRVAFKAGWTMCLQRLVDNLHRLADKAAEEDT